MITTAIIMAADIQGAIDTPDFSLPFQISALDSDTSRTEQR
jgi:hypothetical protein